MTWAGRVARPLAWLALGVLLVLVGTQESRARLQPYYVLRTATEDAAIKPRILFVLDTSGSMGTKTQPADPVTGQLAECRWDRCEDPAWAGTAEESRIAAAKRAISEVITATQDDAKFALLTFLQHDARNSASIFPPTCTVANQPRRFLWVTNYNYPEAGYAWEQIRRYGAYQGAWRLCQGNLLRPYPYLRWDNLGVGSVITSNDESGPVPPSPLISTAQADMSNVANATRKVQWFPAFMGVRFQPNDTTDPGRAITYETVGDYAMNNADRDSQVWEHDFYYWPYVEGFPGYAHWEVNPTNTGFNHSGITGQPNNVQSGKLYAPFYLDLSSTPINPNAWGPADEEQARELVMTHTAPIALGGVDVAGNTPWFSTIGPVPAAPTQSNAYNAHSTVSSYLAFVSNVESPDVCAPTAAVLITDGTPFPATEGGSGLYRRLADLRHELGTQVYVVGMFLDGADELNEMACAGAGACDGAQCDTPCDDAPADAWDTCANPSSPATECAFLASSADELQQVLSQIVAQIGDFDLSSGPGSTANEFGVEGGGGSEIDALQTSIAASTEFPTWRGHVTRSYCDFRDPETDELLPACVPPSPEFAAEAAEETFGPCPQSRAWDAGECLALTPWNERRIFTHDANNELVPVSDPDGSASAGFVTELQAQGIVSGAQAEAQADEIVAFLLGRDAPGSWKLPGLANSAPIIVQRVPPYDPARLPSVAIRDPHCGGRLLGASDGVPASLEEYAEAVWDEDNRLANPSSHYEAQEAVLVGDDFGVLHAFQLDSGNELWGFIPRFLLQSLAEKSAIGAATYGQPSEVEDHDYGLAATLNRGWVFDDRAVDPEQHRWRQLAIIGMGPGGTEHMVLDLSHMSPVSPQGPFEVLWTTQDPALEAQYDLYNGETWARPALGYHVPGEVSTQEPDAFFVMGSGYPTTGGAAEQGRTLLRVDALTGEIVEYAVLPPVDPDDNYEPAFGTVTDPSVATHCLSRMWAEMQEVYIADPAGRLFRWDLGRETNHAADSGGAWGTAAKPALAAPIPACEGAGSTCTVGSGNVAETFTFAPAVTANDRLDDITSVSSAGPVTPTNQFLVALAGGSPSDDALRNGPGANYQSSLYVIVDDHVADQEGGIVVPDGAPKTAPGVDPRFMRVAVTDIERTRTIIPYEGADTFEETRTFARGTRPIRAPRIFVTGVVDEETLDDQNPTVIEGVEVYNIQFTVYEPPSAICDPVFYDEDEELWHEDPGSTFLITYRLTANVGTGFDLVLGAGTGAGASADFGAGFSPGLTLASVEQIGSGDCANGGCGPQMSNPASAPCDNNQNPPVGQGGAGAALAVTHTELTAFTPIE